MSLTDILLVIIGAVGLYFAYKDIRQSTDRNKDERTEKEQEQELAQARKISELEGKMESTFRELNVKVQGLEKALGEMKFSNATFETRLIAGVDKLENKIDKLLMDFYQTRKTN